MITYLDTSVVLRWVLGQHKALAHPVKGAALVTSRLTNVEALRTLDRLRRQGGLTDADYAERHGLTVRLLARVDRAHIYAAVLRRAAEPFPLPLGTLDSIHLSTALLVRDTKGVDVVFATHDVELDAAARSVGLETIGT